MSLVTICRLVVSHRSADDNGVFRYLSISEAELASKVSTELFSTFLWETLGPRDEDWPCEDPEEHSKLRKSKSNAVQSGALATAAADLAVAEEYVASAGEKADNDVATQHRVTHP